MAVEFHLDAPDRHAVERFAPYSIHAELRDGSGLVEAILHDSGTRAQRQRPGAGRPPQPQPHPGARQDLLDGVIDQRVVDLLAWVVERHTISVSVLKTGHSKLVSGSVRISNHWYGRGLDIYAVDETVSSRSTASRVLAEEAIALPAPKSGSPVGRVGHRAALPGRSGR